MLVKFAVQEFLDDRRFKNLSEKTIEGYKLGLKKFEEFLINRDLIDVDDITPATIKSYLLELKNQRNNNATSINTKLKNLKAFFNYLEFEEILKQNPTKKIGFTKEDIKIEVFTDNQIRQMLYYYRRLKYRNLTHYAIRDYTIIIILLGTAMRLGELVSLKWQNVDLDNYSITVYGKKREYSSIPINEKLKKELREYQVFCRKTLKVLPEYVFTDRSGIKLTDNAVKNIFKRLKKIMNFKDIRLSPHTFRHTFAHRALMAGMDVFTLQKMLRHKHISMTERYLALWGTALREQNEKYNPLNKFEL